LRDSRLTPAADSRAGRAQKSCLPTASHVSSAGGFMRIRIGKLRIAGGAGVLAALIAVAGLVPLAAPASAAATVTRYAGQDRYDTAAKIATGNFTTADTVVLATGENFPDALAGTYLAGVNSAPIL